MAKKSINKYDYLITKKEKKCDIEHSAVQDRINRFVDVYFECGCNAAKAYKKAELSSDSADESSLRRRAWTFVRRREVQHAIMCKSLQLQRDSNMTFKMLTGLLAEFANLGLANAIDNADKISPSDALKAADLLCKMHGLYSAEKRVNVNLNKSIDDEELKKARETFAKLREQRKKEY